MKVFNYIILTLGMIFILHLAGIDTGSTILNMVGIEDGNIKIDTSALWYYLFKSKTGLLTFIGIGASIVAGIYTSTKTENIIIWPFVTTYLVNFVTALVNVTNSCLSGEVPTWLAYLILALLAPLTFGLVFSLVEFFRGTD